MVKAGFGFYPNAIFTPLNMGLISRQFAFHAIQKRFAHLANLCYEAFCKFLGDLWVCLGGNSFLQRICKI